MVVNLIELTTSKKTLHMPKLDGYMNASRRVFLAILLAAAGCSERQGDEAKAYAVAESKPQPTQSQGVPVALPTDWDYTVSTDPISDGKILTASISSENQIQFDSPTMGYNEPT